MKKISLLFILLIVVSCNKKKEGTVKDLTSMTWSAIENQAKGKTVTMQMWMGDAKINQYMKNYIVPKVKKENNINLQIVDGQGTSVVQLLMTEQQANKTESDIDLMWINGFSL